MLIPKILNISLLSLYEATSLKKTKPELLKADDCYWLSTPCINKSSTMIINQNGYIHTNGEYVYHKRAIRPVLKIENSKSNLFNTFNLVGYTWTIINEDTALMDTCVRDSFGEILNMEYSKDFTNNKFEDSDINKFLKEFFDNEIMPFLSEQGMSFKDINKTINNVKKGIIKNIPEIKGISLLSIEQAEKIERFNPFLLMNSTHYFLKDAGTREASVSYIRADGKIIKQGIIADHPLNIRPILILGTHNLKIYDILELNNYRFVLFDSNIAILDDILKDENNKKIYIPFNKNYKKGNNYENSDIKEYLDNFLYEKLLTLDTIIENKISSENNTMQPTIENCNEEEL